jgi:hypothetical protein
MNNNFVSLGANAESLLNRVMNINVGGNGPYKSILSAVMDRDKLLRYYGVRCKVGTEKEGLGGREIIAIDSRSKIITNVLDMGHKEILATLKHHKHYLGTRMTGMAGVSVSCMCFDIKAIEGIAAPDVSMAEAVPEAAAAESSETAALETASETADDDDVKFGE